MAQIAPKDPTVLTLQNARSGITCVECRKPRLIYSKHALTDRQQTSLALLLSEAEYSCTGPITGPSHPLHNTVVTRIPMHCGDPVEVPYYRTGYGPVNLCSYCAQDGRVIDPHSGGSIKLSCLSVRHAKWMVRSLCATSHMGRKSKGTLTLWTVLFSMWVNYLLDICAFPTSAILYSHFPSTVSTMS